MIFSFGVLAPLFAISAVIAIVLHEVAHGLVAKWNGDLTAKYAGRITLNPLKHFELLGFILLIFAGFGFAKPVPVNFNNFKRKRLGIFLVSIAGVSVNLIMVFLCAFFIVIIERFGYTHPLNFNPPFLLGWAQGDGTGFIQWASGVFGAHPVTIITHFFFVMLMLINANLVVFNLLPFFPLDGHRVLESAFGPANRVVKFLRDWGPGFLMILIGLGFIFNLLASFVPNYPPWLNPLWYVMRYVGGGIMAVFLNLFRVMFGVPVSWAL